MKKVNFYLILLFAFVLFAPSLKAQTIPIPVKTAYTENAVSYSIVNYSLDSVSMASGINSVWFDWTFLKTNTFYISSSLVANTFDATTKCDTIQCIIQGLDEAGNIFNIDTISGGYGTTAAGSETIVSHTSVIVGSVGKYISPNYGNMFWATKIRFRFVEKLTGATTRHVYDNDVLNLTLTGKGEVTPSSFRIKN
jgi:hypothetical protein